MACPAAPCLPEAPLNRGLLMPPSSWNRWKALSASPAAAAAASLPMLPPLQASGASRSPPARTDASCGLQQHPHRRCHSPVPRFSRLVNSCTGRRRCVPAAPPAAAAVCPSGCPLLQHQLLPNKGKVSQQQHPPLASATRCLTGAAPLTSAAGTRKLTSMRPTFNIAGFQDPLSCAPACTIFDDMCWLHR